jgi:hypothetical protein
MTRNAEIVSASLYSESSKHGERALKGFVEGAKWADRHPAWRNMRTERPKDGESVLAVVDWGVKQSIQICTYRECDKWVLFCNPQRPIDLWMPLPEIPALVVMD